MPTLAQRIAWEHHVQESQRKAGMKTQSLAQRMQAEKAERERAVVHKQSFAEAMVEVEQKMRKVSTTEQDVHTPTKGVAMQTVEEDEDYVLV